MSGIRNSGRLGISGDICSRGVDSIYCIHAYMQPAIRAAKHATPPDRYARVSKVSRRRSRSRTRFISLGVNPDGNSYCAVCRIARRMASLFSIDQFIYEQI